MPGIDLTALSSPELKRLLMALRARGDEALAASVEAEIAARGASAARVVRPAGGAYAVAERWEDSAWPDNDDSEPQARMSIAPDPLTAGLASDGAPLTLSRERERRRSVGPLVAASLLAGGLITAGTFVGVQAWRGGAFATTPARVMAALAAPATPKIQPAASALAPAPAAPPTVQAAIATPPAAPAPATSWREQSTPTPRPIRMAKAQPAEERPRRLDPCARTPTYADRLVCDDLGLQALDVEFRNAYARARDAHADPVILNEGQDAWRRARDETNDPTRLARLYDARIRELNEAAAAAKREEPPFD